MRTLAFLGIVGATLFGLAGPAGASHLNCDRAWPGTPTEANQAWAACHARDDAEHVQMLKDAQQRQAEDRARQAAERDRQAAEQKRQYQRAEEERRTRASVCQWEWKRAANGYTWEQWVCYDR